MAELKKINAANQLKNLLADYFYELDDANKTKNKKIAWCTSVGPVELLRAFGFLVYFPENHGAMLGATRTATDCIPSANAFGYSPDICSYLTSDVGAFLKNFTPLSKAYPGIEKVPEPDVLVYNTNQCRDVQDWLYFYHRKFNVPILGVQTFKNVNDVMDTHVKSIARQMEGLIKPLEEISSKKFDIDELRQILANSKKTTDLWKKILDTAENTPSPITFFDGTIHMGPAVVLRGDERSNNYYEILLSEMNDRIKNGICAVDGEKHRFYWEGMPIWGKLREHSELFANLKACVVASTYCNSWIFEAFEPDDPFMSMARAYTELFIVRSDSAKEKYLTKEFERFKIDGVLYHDAKTCPNNSNNRYGMPNRLFEKTKIPYTIINGDLNDLRCYSNEQTKTNIEAFVEQLE